MYSFGNAARYLEGGPATFLVLGSEGSGKTSFINTMLLLAHANSPGMCPSAPRDRYKVCHGYDNLPCMLAACKEDGEAVLDRVLFRAVDSPPVTVDAVGLTRLTRVLGRGAYDMMGVDGADAPGWDRVACDCVVIVVKYRGCNMDDLKKLADVVHDSKLPLVVAVTHKDKAEPSSDPAHFIEEVARICHNSEVFFLKNCVKRSSMDTETEHEMEALFKHAVLYTIRRRTNIMLYHKEQVTEDLPKQKEEEEEESDDDMGFSLFD